VPAAQRVRTWLSLWTVYLVWGSTYFAIAKTVETMPPLLSMGVRFLVAAILLGVYLLARNGASTFKIPRKEIISASFLGVMTLAFGIGTVAIAEEHIPTGVTSLIIAALPLWIALFRTIAREKISKLTWLGTIIGFLGVVVLLQPGSIEPINNATSKEVTFYMFIVLFGNLAFAFGTYISPRFQLPKNLLLFTTIEMAAAGIFMLLAALIRGEDFSRLSEATLSSWFWFAYLVLVGSILAYSAYLWLVVNAPVSLIATYAYVNPVIAIILGIIFLNEVITNSYALGGLIILLGVLTVVTSESRAKEKK
jgi:drug/metabolite transporter (DMT)-like permease